MWSFARVAVVLLWSGIAPRRGLAERAATLRLPEPDVTTRSRPAVLRLPEPEAASAGGTARPRPSVHASAISAMAALRLGGGPATKKRVRRLPSPPFVERHEAGVAGGAASFDMQLCEDPGESMREFLRPIPGPDLEMVDHFARHCTDGIRHAVHQMVKHGLRYKYTPHQVSAIEKFGELVLKLIHRGPDIGAIRPCMRFLADRCVDTRWEQIMLAGEIALMDIAAHWVHFDEGKLDIRGLVEHLSGHLQAEDTTWRKSRYAELLGDLATRIKDDEATAALLHSLRTSRLEVVRTEAARFLGPVLGTRRGALGEVGTAIVETLRHVALGDTSGYARTEAARQLQWLVLDLAAYTGLFQQSLNALRDVAVMGVMGPGVDDRGHATWLLYKAAKNLSWKDERGIACVIALALVAHYDRGSGSLSELLNEEPEYAALPPECVDFIVLEMTRPQWQMVPMGYGVDMRASVPCSDALRRRVDALKR